jgi:hypothetical protein
MRTAFTYCVSLLFALMASVPAVAQHEADTASFSFKGLPLRMSIDSLMSRYAVSIVYLDRDIEGQVVTVSCRECPLPRALDAVLARTSLTWTKSGTQVILRRQLVSSSAQPATLSGFVTDSLTQAEIAGATIRLLKDTGSDEDRDAGWCPSNSAGFYSLSRVPPGSYELVVRLVGYRPKVIRLELSGGESARQDILLQEEEIRLQEVTVEGHRSELGSESGLTRGIYIPSSPGDQNEYFLEGTRIYNPSHFGGVLSTFNSDALSDVRELTGGVPPRYGGEIGSILDLSVRNGTHERLAGSAGTGSLGSHLAVEGPVGRTVSFVISGRRGYPEPIVPNLDHFGTPSRLGSSELMMKISGFLSSRSNFSINGYLGRDSYQNSVEEDAARLDNGFRWGNTAFILRWLGLASSSTFVQASIGYSKYEVHLDQSLVSPVSPLAGADPFLSAYAIEDVEVHAEAEQYYDLEHTVRGGVEAIRHSIRGNISAFATQIAPLAFDGSSVWELAVHIQDQWRFLPGLLAEIGARATSFGGSQGSVSAVDPRFSLLYLPGDAARVSFSLSAVNQFLHPYRNSGVFLLYPTIFWYPSGDRVKPSTALHLRVGAENEWGHSGLVASAQGFYRVVHNLHEFSFDTMMTAIQDLESEVLYGSGKSYGIELCLRKNGGDFSGSISYALSWNTHVFPSLNDGNPFAPPFDRRHEVQITASYSFDAGWEAGVLADLAVESVNSFVPVPLQSPWTYSPANVSSQKSPAALVDMNGNKYPGFQRLELYLRRVFSLGVIRGTVSVRLMNGYGLLDPFEWRLQEIPDPRLRWHARLRDLTLLPLFPTVELNLNF